MICDIFDGAFDSLYLHETFAKISLMPVNFTNVANRKTKPYGYKGTHTLLGATVFSRTSINRIEDIDMEYYPLFYNMFEMVVDHLDVNFYLSAITTNIQPTGCDGTTHTDSDEDDEYTILVMTNPEWEKDWGGQFQLVSESGSVVEEHEYVPGRIILLPSAHPHRGLGPTEKYIYRSSVVFRVTPNLNKHLSNWTT